MKIKCYGSRGSIPVCGKDYLKYGGDTTCITVTSDSGDLIIVDAGTGARRLGNDLIQAQTIKHFSMIFTHAHWDHLMGFPFFKPLFIKDFEIDLYGCPFVTGYSVKDMVAGTMQPPNFPVDINAISAKINFIHVRYSTFQIGSMKIVPIHLSHPNQGIGYKFIENGKTFVFLTDNELHYQHEGGLCFKDYVRDCENVDLLFHDAEYLPAEYEKRRTWGHSTYIDALELGLQAKVKQLGLFHHNQDRRDHEIDAMITDCESIITQRQSTMTVVGIAPDSVIDL